jgi:hypothetical protein
MREEGKLGRDRLEGFDLDAFCSGQFRDINQISHQPDSRSDTIRINAGEDRREGE